VSLRPLDVGTLGASVRRTGRLVVAHDQDPALARHVRQAALDAAFLYLEAPMASALAEAGALVDAARSAVEY
jgi:pyruvate/2-oxoglutarate/acetoin dehydrogenase E1 component